MKCFYHSADLDGHCSGALVKRVESECEMIGINYGDDFPWTKVQRKEIVFMVDFSLQPFEQMVELNKRCNLIWIDHHKSAIEEYEKYRRQNTAFSIDGIRKVGKGACALVWDFLHHSTPLPRFVRLLAEYDVWDHHDLSTLPFQYGMRLLKDTSPSNRELWKLLFEERYVEKIISDGVLVMDYQATENEKYIKARGFTVEVDGLKCIAANKGLTNSQLFDSVWDPDKYDAMLTFCMLSPEKGWTISLYSTKPDVDVSAIAKARGGGGHKGAAGFQCKTLPWEQTNC